jgi:sensor domain CHASE-containing protein
MRNFRALNTYYKLLVLIISTSVFLFLLYVALYIYTSKQEHQLFKTTQKQYYNEVSSIIHLNSKTPISTIIDITFWDELELFTKTKDKGWYGSYIASQFETYEVLSGCL